MVLAAGTGGEMVQRGVSVGAKSRGREMMAAMRRRRRAEGKRKVAESGVRGRQLVKRGHIH